MFVKRLNSLLTALTDEEPTGAGDSSGGDQHREEAC
jgi:hypothetical protein